MGGKGIQQRNVKKTVYGLHWGNEINYCSEKSSTLTNGTSGYPVTVGSRVRKGVDVTSRYDSGRKGTIQKRKTHQKNKNSIETQTHRPTIT